MVAVNLVTVLNTIFRCVAITSEYGILESF